MNSSSSSSSSSLSSDHLPNPSPSPSPSPTSPPPSSSFSSSSSSSSSSCTPTKSFPSLLTFQKEYENRIHKSRDYVCNSLPSKHTIITNIIYKNQLLNNEILLLINNYNKKNSQKDFFLIHFLRFFYLTNILKNKFINKNDNINDNTNKDSDNKDKNDNNKANKDDNKDDNKDENKDENEDDKNDDNLFNKINNYNKIFYQYLLNFYYWPKNDKNLNKNLDNICFWSENHIFLTLTCAHLCFQWKNYEDDNKIEELLNELRNRRQRKEEENINDVKIEVEKDDEIRNEILRKSSINYLDKLANSQYTSTEYLDNLLLAYLSAHCDPNFNGVYEVFSHVYLPYTLAALLNLYDFSLNKKIREMSLYLINLIMEQISLILDPISGSGTLSPSARCFDRTRNRNIEHNINQIHYLLLGYSPNQQLLFTQCIDFFLTTVWRPRSYLIYKALYFDGFISERKMNHTLEETCLVYQYSEGDLKKENLIEEKHKKELKNEEIPSHLIPFLWSAGLVAHPYTASSTFKYIKNKNLKNNLHLWPIARCFFNSFFSKLMKSYEVLSKGQSYLNIILNLYKKPKDGLILSSFSNFNIGIVSYQQLSWMCNMCGVPIYSLSGRGYVTDTHTPCVRQRESLILINYLNLENLNRFSLLRFLLDVKTKIIFPVNYMDKFCFYFAKNGKEEENDESDKNEENFYYYNNNLESNIDYINSKKLKNSYLWYCAERKNCFVGVYCTSFTQLEPIEKIFKENSDPNTHKNLHIIENKEKEPHSWVLVCDVKNNYYQSLKEFCFKRLKSIKINHFNKFSKGQRHFFTSVYDPYLDQTVEFDHIYE